MEDSTPIQILIGKEVFQSLQKRLALAASEAPESVERPTKTRYGLGSLLAKTLSFNGIPGLLLLPPSFHDGSYQAFQIRLRRLGVGRKTKAA